MRKTETRSIFRKLKPALRTIFIARIICIVGCFAVTGYAATNKSNSASLKASSAVSNSEVVEQWKTVQMRVTAYCPCPKCCGNYSDGITASGHKVIDGDIFVAADKRYPFGTEMIIPGYTGPLGVKVLDRGGAIQGDRLDVFFNSHQDALEWGVRYLDVKILL